MAIGSLHTLRLPRTGVVVPAGDATHRRVVDLGPVVGADGAEGENGAAQAPLLYWNRLATSGQPTGHRLTPAGPPRDDDRRSRLPDAAGGGS